MTARPEIRTAWRPGPGETRRAIVRALSHALGLALVGTSALAAGRPRIVTMLGDSITAGYGLPAADALPAQLALALKRLGSNAVVRAAGVSGDTSADGLARVGFSVQPDTEVCVVALGGNDLLQGLDPKALHDNLTAIVRSLKARRMTVILAGMRAPPAIGAGYARQFDAVYPGVARAEKAILYPFLLDGVALNSRLNQKDAIHPNAAGVKIIAARLAPVVARALNARR
jgi:acyl-CoA thioesterase-1